MKLGFLKRKGNTIFLRVVHQSFNCFIKTNYSVPASDWNVKLQQSKTDSGLNIKLLELKNSIANELFRKLNNGKMISLELVKNTYSQIINPVAEKEYTLSEYIEIFCSNHKRAEVVKKLLTVKAQVDQLPPVNITDIDFKWMNSFQKHLLRQDFANSYINKNLSLVIMVLRFSAINDIQIKPSAFAVRNLKESSISHYLNNDELNLIFNLGNLSPRLENVKKLFLIGVHTGLRVSDSPEKICLFNWNRSYIVLNRPLPGNTPKTLKRAVSSSKIRVFNFKVTPKVP